MTPPDDIVVLLDCDKTLLDSDRVPDNLRAHFARELEIASRDRYWAILEELCADVGYVDYLGHCSATDSKRSASLECC